MSTKAKKTEDLSVGQLMVQCCLISVVFLAWSSPLIQPVKIMVVLFHELSHGLMALATGGKVLNIVVTWEEGGFCETEGGIAALIVSAGYLGSMFFGGLLLYLSRLRDYVPVAYTILTLMLAAAILTVLDDPFSRSFATGLAASFLLLGLVVPAMISALFLQIALLSGLVGGMFHQQHRSKTMWMVMALSPVVLSLARERIEALRGPDEVEASIFPTADEPHDPPHAIPASL